MPPRKSTTRVRATSSSLPLPRSERALKECRKEMEDTCAFEFAPFILDGLQTRLRPRWVDKLDDKAKGETNWSQARDALLCNARVMGALSEMYARGAGKNRVTRDELEEAYVYVRAYCELKRLKIQIDFCDFNAAPKKRTSPRKTRLVG